LAFPDNIKKATVISQTSKQKDQLIHVIKIFQLRAA
jgi:hypothetical protein